MLISTITFIFAWFDSSPKVASLKLMHSHNLHFAYFLKIVVIIFEFVAPANWRLFVIRRFVPLQLLDLLNNIRIFVLSHY